MICKNLLLTLVLIPTLSWAKLIANSNSPLEFTDSCWENLQVIHPNWTKNSLRYVCRHSESNCALLVAKAHPHWTAFSLTHACQVPRGMSFDSSCIERSLNLFKMQPTELGNFCRDPRSECMLTYKEARPETSKTMVDAACAFKTTHNCPAQLALLPATSSLSTIEINQACRFSLNAECAVSLALALDQSGKNFGPHFLGHSCKKLDNTCPAFLVEQGKKWDPTTLNRVCIHTNFECVKTNIQNPHIKTVKQLIHACFKQPSSTNNEEPNSL